jgi:hypothetical protein
MLTIKYQRFGNPDVKPAVDKLWNCPNFTSSKIVAHVARFAGEYYKYFMQVSVAHAALVKPYLQHDENGKVITVPGQPNHFVPHPDKQEEWLQKQKEFEETEVKIDCKKFTADLLQPAKLSPRDYASLVDFGVLNPIAQLEKVG